MEGRQGVGVWQRGGTKVLRGRLEEVRVIGDFLVDHEAALQFLLDGAALASGAHVLPVCVVLIEGKGVQKFPVAEW